MKKSKENEHRISNLKDMLNNVKDEDINESADNSEDVFDVKDNEEYEEDEELLAYLHDTDDNKEYEIDDEFIYRPDSDSTPGENLEKKEINEDYIIKTKLDDIEFSEETIDYLEYLLYSKLNYSCTDFTQKAKVRLKNNGNYDVVIVNMLLKIIDNIL